MTQRNQMLAEFVAKNACEPASLNMIAGDASNRKYYRVRQNDHLRIVMDAPPDKGEDVKPFIEIANYLSNIGLSAPKIFAEDHQLGFLLIEDLGDDLFARVLERQGADENTLYTAAIDALAHLHGETPPELARYTANLMADMSALAFVWYRDHGKTDGDELTEIVAQLKSSFVDLEEGPLVLIQRDYHAENLLWLPDRIGVARVGMLDFQDAMMGHPAYDLVSILQDARRDVSAETVQAALANFLTQTGHSEPTFRRAYHLLGLQRNLRILGVFARLWLRDGKAGYLPLIPRVWNHIQHNLEVLNDRELSHLVNENLVPPSAAVLDALEAARP